MGEMLTIFNQDGSPLGVKEREAVHHDGDWHETFHCWFFEKRGEEVYLLFQQRANNKKEFPGLYDITAAGHIEAGENHIEAGLREIEEEIGLTVEAERLRKAGDYKEELIEDHLVDREICRVFLHLYEKGMEFFLGDEVQDLVRVPLVPFSQLVEGSIDRLNALSITTKTSTVLTPQDFVPHELEYERFVIDSIRRSVAKL